ncbi:MAG: neutral/alkaline non-lysosomal ceramidase N-terminal domain-containing protein [Archangium sp.]|nr:neutral/alkaline non-lysosomal ceramidase N-terminal domain-containing protein [Archangium sp.]
MCALRAPLRRNQQGGSTVKDYSPRFNALASEPSRSGSLKAGWATGFVPSSVIPSTGKDEPRALIGYGPDIAWFRECTWTNHYPLRVIVIDDGSGGRVALIVAELWSASTYVLDRLGELLHNVSKYDGVHIMRDQLFLSGTHTHCSPGGFYESPYYSRLAEPWPHVTGFKKEAAEGLASAIADLLVVATRNLVDVEIAFTMGEFSGNSRNRSMPAFQNNQTREPEVESSLPLLLIRKVATRRVCALWSAVNCHATTQPSQLRSPDTDFIGRAASELDAFLSSLETTPVGEQPPLAAVCAGAIGDTDPLPRAKTQEEYLKERADLGKTLGHRNVVAAALVASVKAAIAATPPTSWKSRLRVAGIQSSVQVSNFSFAGRTMPTQPRVGKPVIGGSELCRGMPFYDEGITTDSDDRSDPHWPKDSTSDIVINAVNGYFKGQSDSLNLSILKVGSTWLLGLPGEPTTQFARNLKHHLTAAIGPTAPTFVVCGVNGGYNGYFVTEREYVAQHYEGASCIWGRHTEAFLKDRFVLLAKSKLPIRREQSVSLNFEEEPAGETILSRLRRAGLALIEVAYDEPEIELVLPGATPQPPRLGTGLIFRPLAVKPSGRGWKFRFLLPLDALGKTGRLIGAKGADFFKKSVKGVDALAPHAVVPLEAIDATTEEITLREPTTDW